MERKKGRISIVTICITILAAMLIMVSGCDGPLGGGTDEQELIVGPGHFTSIQDAIDLAADGDEIILLPGTYKQTVNFEGKNITLRSATREELDGWGYDYPGNPDDFDIVAATVIDGDGGEAVIALDSGEEREAVIKGLTITGGGMGIYIRKGSVATITGNIIKNNTNGGIHLVASSSNADSSETPSKATISWNIIRGNVRGIGGGIYLGYRSEALIEHNTITNNTATETNSPRGGGGIGYYTHMSHSTNSVIRNNIIHDNTAYRVGGGIFLMGSAARFTITGNDISGNVANPNAQASGGGIYVGSCLDATIHDNVFDNNYAKWRAGAMHVISGKTYGTNNTLMEYGNFTEFNTFTNNTATDEPAYGDIYLDN